MLGAIVGDYLGSVHEFHAPKHKEFELLDPRCTVTDDSILTLGVAEWLLDGVDLATRFHELRYEHPGAGWGMMFARWAGQRRRKPYNSFGNGSAMRVSPVGWAFATLDETLEAAAASANVTHNHPEGVKGAQATALAVFLARTRRDKDLIRHEISRRFGYDLTRTLADIRPTYVFDETCQRTVPEAITAFLESSDFEDAIRNAISLGGDADTLACIAGGIAHAYYGGVPAALAEPALASVPVKLRGVWPRFQARFKVPPDPGATDIWTCLFCGRKAPQRKTGGVICHSHLCECGALALDAPLIDIDEAVDDAVNIFGRAVLTEHESDRFGRLRRIGVEIRDEASEGRAVRRIWFRRTDEATAAITRDTERLVDLLRRSPNPRLTRAPDDLKGNFDLWFDGGAALHERLLTRYKFADGSWAVTYEGPVERIDIFFPDGRRNRLPPDVDPAWYPPDPELVAPAPPYVSPERPIHAPPMAPIPFRESYSTEEWAALHSEIPRWSSDDKWYTRWDGDWLAWHRAWTGFLVYRLRFQERKGRYEVVEALVCNDNDTYRRPTESDDVALLDWLIQYFLFHRELDVPLPEGMEDDAPG